MDKRTFVYHMEWYEVIEDLEPTQFCEMERAIILYAGKGIEPKFTNKSLSLLFRLVKMKIDEDNAKYLEVKEKRAEAGRKGGKQTQANQANAIKSNQKQANQSNANKSSVYDNDSVYDSVNDNGIISPSDDVDNVNNKKTISKKVFRKPTLEEVQAYCTERGNNIDAARFIDHYESVGWKVGKNPMKDWQAAIRTWERNQKEAQPAEASDPNRPSPKEWAGVQKLIADHGGRFYLEEWDYMRLKAIAHFKVDVVRDVLIDLCGMGSIEPLTAAQELCARKYADRVWEGNE